MSQRASSTKEQDGKSKSSTTTTPERAVLEMLLKFYAAMGHAPEVEGALAAMAGALLSKATIDQISIALDRCMTETGGYPVRLPHIFARIPGLDANLNAEKRLAWDTVEKYVNKWLRWDSERISATVAAEAPELAPRIRDTVRRTGGWTVYLRMTDDDFPYVQKRFFEEYEAWAEIQHVAADPSKMLEMPRRKELA
jgi:hypothetical protein